jgi:hypothetical protein
VLQGYLASRPVTAAIIERITLVDQIARETRAKVLRSA